jgi:hypothetical protein
MKIKARIEIGSIGLKREKTCLGSAQLFGINIDYRPVRGPGRDYYNFLIK